MSYPAKLVVLALAGITLALMTGCTSSTSPSAVAELEDSWLDAYYIYIAPIRDRDISWVTCALRAELGGEGGDAVSGLSVTCNGEALVFNQSSYLADITDIAPGETVTFAASDGQYGVTASVDVPQPPSNLVLEGGTWDFSNPGGSHTLTWSNPATQADSVLVALAGQGLHPLDVYAYSTVLPSDVTQVVLSNTDLADFSGATEIKCLVSQSTLGAFTGHAGGSEVWVRAAIEGVWR